MLKEGGGGPLLILHEPGIFNHRKHEKLHDILPYVYWIHGFKFLEFDENPQINKKRPPKDSL